jgi:hypothetical protein
VVPAAGFAALVGEGAWPLCGPQALSKDVTAAAATPLTEAIRNRRLLKAETLETANGRAGVSNIATPPRTRARSHPVMRS